MATIKYGTLELIPAPQLGLNVQSNFFPADIRYSKTKSYTLRGDIFGYYSSGVSGVYNSVNQITTGFQQDYQPFILDGTIVGYPKIKSVSFDAGTWVQRSQYSIELEIAESGNPFQITGGFYGFTGVTGLFHNIASLTESLEYESDFKVFSYNHSVNIQYNTGFNINPLNNARFIASGLLSNKSSFPFVVTGSPYGNKTYEESINEFAGQYSVTERFKGTTGNLAFEHLYALHLQLSQDGITTVSQDGTIRGLVPDKYETAKSGYTTIKNGIYSNCTGFYSNYAGGTLNNTYLTDTRFDDVNNGIVRYSRSFTDESGVSDVRWRYVHEITLQQNTYQCSERGSIQGLGGISSRFNQASGWFDVVKTGIYSRVINQFSGNGGTGLLFNNSIERSFDRFNGGIQYNYGYANSPGLGVGSGIFQYESSVSDEICMANRVDFNIVSVGVISQSLSSTKQGQRTVSVNAQAFRDTARQTIYDFCKHKLNENRPIDAQYLDPFINSLETFFNVNENSLTANASYIYGGYKRNDDLFV